VPPRRASPWIDLRRRITEERAMEDVDYLRLLRDALQSGAVTVSLDFGKLEHIDSPISVQADSNRWIYSLIVIVSAAAWLGGVWWAVGAASAGATAWFAVGKRWHRRRMEQRFHQVTVHNLEDWKKLWRMPGIVLTEAKTGNQSQSPSGNWRALVAAAMTDPAVSAASTS
jgi:hypothetical protein